MALELHSCDLPTEQLPPIDSPSTYDGDILTGEPVKATADADYLAELAFMEEPVVLRLEPSAEKNAQMAFPVWVNGKPAEVLINGRWVEAPDGYLPVAMVLTVKRKVLEVILRSKITTLNTEIDERDAERPNNRVLRFTAPVHSFSIIEDKNPRGMAWATEIRRRNL